MLQGQSSNLVIGSAYRLFSEEMPACLQRKTVMKVGAESKND
jgi:hypothetical protein